jgi:2-keto-4-pentenoate hydratase
MDIEQVARELSIARRSRSLLEPPSRSYHNFTLEDGYDVGRLLHQEALAAGSLPVGIKIGFTNKAVWSQLGLDRPFWAPMYDTTVTDKREVSLGGLVAARIEPEIVVGFRTDLQSGASLADVCAAVSWAATGFEIVQCHYPGWEMAPADAIADSGLHGLLVVGDRAQLDLQDGTPLAEIEVELQRETTTVARGRGSYALGGPIEAITWLLQVPKIRAGSIITTGTLTPAFPIAPNETWRLSTTGPVSLGQLQVSFSS